MYTKVCHKQVHEMSTAELMLLEEEESIRMSEKSRMKPGNSEYENSYNKHLLEETNLKLEKGACSY